MRKFAVLTLLLGLVLLVVPAAIADDLPVEEVAPTEEVVAPDPVAEEPAAEEPPAEEAPAAEEPVEAPADEPSEAPADEPAPGPEPTPTDESAEAPDVREVAAQPAAAQPAAAPEDNEGKFTICHATHSATNPYITETVAFSAVDGVGNFSDHVQHSLVVPGLPHPGSVNEQPMFDPAIHGNGDDWGDIIPPVANHDGVNWPEGQEVFENDCNFPGEQPEPVGVLSVPDCENQTVTATVENPTDATITAHVFINGTLIDSFEIEAGATSDGPPLAVADGDVVELFIGDSETATETLTVDLNCPAITVSKECVAAATAGATIEYSITVTNTGTEDLGEVVVNDPLLGGDLPFDGELAVGASETLTFEYVTDANTPNPLVNTVTATGIGVESQETVTATDDCSIPITPPPPPALFGTITEPTCENPEISGEVVNDELDGVTAIIEINGEVVAEFEVGGGETVESLGLEVQNGDFVQLFVVGPDGPILLAEFVVDLEECPVDEPTAALIQGDCIVDPFVTLDNPGIAARTFTVNGQDFDVPGESLMDVAVDFGPVTVTVGEDTVLEATAVEPGNCGGEPQVPPVPPVPPAFPPTPLTGIEAGSLVALVGLLTIAGIGLLMSTRRRRVLG